MTTETLSLVTRALLTAAGLLLVLVAGLTWLVTRQVVTPVRMARRVAERLQARGVPTRIGSRSGRPPFDWEDRSTWAPVLEGVRGSEEIDLESC